MRFTVTFLGTSAALPTADRGLAATVVQQAGQTLLIDCGEGTQRQLRRSAVGLVQVDAVLLTHLHGDHCLGLIGLLKSYDLFARRSPLHLYGPAGLRQWVDVISPLVGPVGFDVEVEELHDGQHVTVWKGLAVNAFGTRHRVPSLGYRLAEPPRPGVFDVAAAQRLGLQPGPAYAALQRGETVTVDGVTVRPEQVVGRSRSGRTAVFTGDTEPCPATIEAAQAADLLVHEATFVAANREQARLTMHSCADEAAEVALQAGARRLALTHLSQRTTAQEVLAEAAPIFPGVIVPSDLEQVELPLID